MFEEKYDLILIGAGPTGASAARESVKNGFKTLVIEKHKLPRYKACDGLVMDESLEFIKEQFGEIPNEIYSNPKLIRGIKLEFDDGLISSVEFEKPAGFLIRKEFDNFLVQNSGAVIHDETSLIEITKNDSYGVEIICRRNGQNIRYRAKYLIGADGANSTVQRLVDKLFWEERVAPYRFFMGKVHYQGDLNLDKEWWHSFFIPKTGALNLITKKDDTITIENCIRNPKDFKAVHGKTIDILQKRYGLKIENEIKKDSLMLNQRSVMDRFYFGKDNILLAGEAAGFTLLWGEGITIGMYSGKVAVESIVASLAKNVNAVDEYSKNANYLRKRSLREWNPIRLIVGRPGNVGSMDPKYGLTKLPLFQRVEKTMLLLNSLKEFGSSLRHLRVSMENIF